MSSAVAPMTEAPPSPSAGSVPVPDPTALTATAVNQAKEDLRREMASLRELLVTRLDGAVNELRILGITVAELQHALPSGREELRERLQNDIATAVSNLQDIQEEKFLAVQQQFTERDVRGEQEKKSSKEALDAALLAQKESVSQQNDANTTAATKSETSFTKQIDQIGTLIATLEKSLTDRITELKERIDRGEGVDTGTDKYDDIHRQNAALIQTDAIAKANQTRTAISIGIAALSVLISIVVVIVLIAHGG